jgi:starch synthase
MAPIDVLAVVSEIFPLIKTGGLADVAGALPGALAADSIRVRSLVPGYPQVLDALEGGVAIATLDDLFGGSARIVAAPAAGLDLFVIDAPHLYRRPGGLLHVSPGLGTTFVPFRFCARPEATELVLHSG